MVAPKFGPAIPAPVEASGNDDQQPALLRNDSVDITSSNSISIEDKRRASRQAILSSFVAKAVEYRQAGNEHFKLQSFEQAAARYSEALFVLQKVPVELALTDILKVLNNRSKCYVKLGRWGAAEADIVKALSMEEVDEATRAALLLTRYYARTALGAVNEARRDLEWSAELGNKAAMKELSAKAGGSAAESGAVGVIQKHEWGGGTSDRQSHGHGVSPKTAPATPNRGAGDNYYYGAAAAAVAKVKDKLEARLDAAAGEELVFGGSSAVEYSRDTEVSSTFGLWGKRPVPDNTALSSSQTSSGSRGAHIGISQKGKSTHGHSEDLDGRAAAGAGGDVDGGGGGGDILTNMLNVRRRKRCTRQRLSPSQSSQELGTTVMTTFTPTTGTSKDTQNEISDTFPPPHPLFAHSAVTRCFIRVEGIAASRDGGESAHMCDSNNSIGGGGVENVSSCTGNPAVVDAAVAKAVGGPRSDRSVGDDHVGEGDASVSSSVGNGSSVCAADEALGKGGRAQRPKGGTEERSKERSEGGKTGAAAAAAVSEVVKAVPKEDFEGPPPAKQAQDIQWLVSQAKAEPAQGDVWAVLDREWWLKWQKYTGCNEDAAAAAGHDESAAEEAVAVGGGGESNYGDDPVSSSPESGAIGEASGTLPNGIRKQLDGGGAGEYWDDRSGSAVGESRGNEADPLSIPAAGGDRQVSPAARISEDGSVASSGGAFSSASVGDSGSSDDISIITPAPDQAHSVTDVAGDEAGEETLPVTSGANNHGVDLAKADADNIKQHPHPGPIDNSALVLEAGTPGIIPGSGRRLRLHLVRGYHFVLVPQEAWLALHAWYGGGPALPRELVPVKDSDTGLVVYEPQLYPEFSRLDPVLRSIATMSPLLNQDQSPSEFNEASPSCSSSSTPSSTEPQPPSSNGHTDSNGHSSSSSTCYCEDAHRHPASNIAEERTSVNLDKDGCAGQGDEVGGRRGLAGSGAKALGREAAGTGQCAACGRIAREKCGRCLKSSHRVFYCSRSCQEAHWRYHRRQCGGRDLTASLAIAKRGKAGLNNLGNTCFLNSAVQCLSHVQPLTQHILTNAFREDINISNPLGTGGCLVREYENVLKDLWFGSGSSVSPTALKTAIAKFAPQFNGYSQQDSQEVLSFLLDGLHEDLNRVLKKPYIVLPDGECGRPDAVIAAECWDMFSKRDRSVLVESLYGQFKSTLECPQCGKLSRKFDEFNVMPVELLAGRRYQVILDFAPLLAPTLSAPVPGGEGAYTGETPSDRAARMLGGGGKEGRKPRRVAVVLPRDALIGHLKEELAGMLGLDARSLLIVVVTAAGPAMYRALDNTEEVWKYNNRDYDLTAHECIPEMRHALVVNRVFDAGRHLAHPEMSPEEGEQGRRKILQRWEAEVKWLDNVRSADKDGAFIVSFPEDVSCLGLMQIVWTYMRDFLHLTAEEHEGLYIGDHLARSGQIKISDASDSFAPRFHHQRMTKEDPNERYMRGRADQKNYVVTTGLDRYLPPLDTVRAAAVLDAGSGPRHGMDYLRLDWSGRLLERMDTARVAEPYGINHSSVDEADRRVKRVSLPDCLEKFSVPETLCEDNSWYCGNCKELRQAVKTIQVWSLPKVLILHFKRFAHTGPARGKVELFVDFPINGLDMSPYCRGETLEGGRAMPALYDLFAVSNHMGGMGHGHYTAFVRDWDGSGMSKQWFVCDDHDCRPVEEYRVRTSAAYVLFYRRRPLAS